MIYVDPNASTSGDGRCVSPYDTLQGAQGDAAPGSLLFLAPATYLESGPLILDTSMTLTSIGSAVIR